MPPPPEPKETAKIAVVRLLLLFLLSAILVLGQTFKLYMKDGDYHIVREYHVEGDRVRYYSTERGDWEEIPLALVDLEKTEKQRSSKVEAHQQEQKQIAEEEQAERAQRKEIESIPMDTGAYYKSGEQVRPLDAAQYQLLTNKKRMALKMLSPIPLVPGKASVIIQGEHSKFVVHEERPEFFFRPEREERFGIIKVTPKKNVRVVENVSILPVVNQATEDRQQIEVFQQQLMGNLYKVWPEKPIEPGEYAVIEFDDNADKDKNNIELMVWDFAYQPAK